MVEDMAKLGDIALKLERYRHNIASALSWVIFGMIFGSMVTLGNSLVLLGFGGIFWILLILAGITSGYIYYKFWKYVPENREVKRRWKIGLVFLFLPFIIAYSIPLPIKTPLYCATIWYPSLGVGLLICGLYVEKTSLVKSTVYAGVLILLTSPLLLPLFTMPVNPSLIVAAESLCTSMMILIYFITAIYAFFKAEKTIYA
ncbi:hypothetical protein DRP04_05405 [Archaeoglobales archaeon]|nr:MAG: hypothetical protein DRP04_05405 [Archaeoglobales archaeon]